ncbi:hypothetical protein [Mycoplasmopsis gallopavonis]|uniref:Uncharacterized protein n=1 Tax=Mycoplasmopsis gallopavonis TaxID=76629 RepID=A0A449AYV9_9BACT|nr:hypothetical protein [Mycoplasmopsis gallopavonis]RIV16870.1 hypothetical protein D1113_00595 [Mycoplasmopsis gallopavonis]VEU72672.1 Uncharacterised protein [Mycoplasmopsis gallopavonis]
MFKKSIANIWKILKFLIFFGFCIFVYETVSFGIFLIKNNKEIKNHKFQIWNKTKLEKWNNIRKYDLFTLKNFGEFEYTIKEKNIINILPSEINNLSDIDSFFSFNQIKSYKDYNLIAIEPIDELGALILFLKSQKNKLEPIKNIILTGFKKRNKENNNTIEKTSLNTPNNQLLYSFNFNQKTINGNLTFFNYLKPKNENQYPTKWFAITSAKNFLDNLNLEKINLKIANKFSKTNIDAHFFLDGRNQWETKIDLSYFLENNEKIQAKPFLDYLILEINFENEEQAKLFTSKDKIASFWSNEDNHENGFYKQKDSQLDFYTFNKNFFNFDLALSKKINNSLFTDFQNNLENSTNLLRINSETYIDLSTNFKVSIPLDNQDIVGSIYSNSNQKYLLNFVENNSSWWLPLKYQNNAQNDFRNLLLNKYNDKVSNFLTQYTYDIFRKNTKTNQNKSFQEVFNQKYPNQELGYIL